MTAVSDIDWLLISLKRTPERLAHFQAVNSHLGLPIEILEAVDGLKVDRQGLIDSGLMESDITWGPGAIGAALSHRLCWLRAVETGRPVFIVEYDVYLRRDFVTKTLGVIDALPDHWEIVHFGYNTDSGVDIELLPGSPVRGLFNRPFPTQKDCQEFVEETSPVVPLRLNNAFGNCSYLLAPRGAQKMLDGCFPMSITPFFVPVLKYYLRPQSKDGRMNALYRNMEAFVCVPPLSMPVNDKRTSTVQAP